MSRKALWELTDRRKRDRLGPRPIEPPEEIGDASRENNQNKGSGRIIDANDEQPQQQRELQREPSTENVDNMANAVTVQANSAEDNWDSYDEDEPLQRNEFNENERMDLDDSVNDYGNSNDEDGNSQGDEVNENEAMDQDDSDDEYFDSHDEMQEDDARSEQSQEDSGCSRHENAERERSSEESSAAEDQNLNEAIQNCMPRADGENIRARQPLYRGAPITVAESMLLILTILLHHDVTYACLADIITVINLHCLHDQLKKNSLYKFQQYFSFHQSEVKKHFYCSTCLRILETVNTMCPSCPRKKQSYFVELPFIEQLREMYKRNNFYNDLQWRFNRQKPPPGHLSDIYDSSLYSEWMERGFLQNPNNISFSWYTDGIPVFKSSKISIWPLYLTINELPPQMRKKKENTILAGLWFGDSKPHPNIFLKPFQPVFENLLGGIEMQLPLHNEVIRVRAILLTGTCDLPAKSLFLNFTQFNGDYGCPVCTTKGENIPTDAGGTVHVYRYNPYHKLRTTEECTEIGKTATPDNAKEGIKGPTTLSKIMPDFMRGIGIDKMHGIDGGIVKKMLTLLFDVKYRTCGFSLYEFIDVINVRLTSIKPPKFVHRMPRSVKDLLHWKSSELRLWFFHYSLPVFQGVLRQDLFDHYLLLVVAISLLNSDVISPVAITIAQDFLHKFVKRFEDLYGLQFCSINVHQLLHLPNCVQLLGPLWTFSCYEYENLNGQFLKLIHGTWHIDTQVAKSHSQFIQLVRYIQELPEGPLKDYCLNKKYQVKIIERIVHNCYSVGTYECLRDIPPSIHNAMARAGFIRYSLLLKYCRLLKGGKLHIAEAYGRSLQTVSSVVEYSEDGVSKLGSVQYFIKMVEECQCPAGQCECQDHHIAIIREIVREDTYTAHGDAVFYDTRKFLWKCHLGDNTEAVDIHNLQSVCIKMVIDEQMFIGIPVNQQELE